MFAFNHSVGSEPVSRLRWKMTCSIGAISTANSFMALGGMASGPDAIDGLRCCRSFSIPSRVITIGSMSGSRDLGAGRSFDFTSLSYVKTI